MAVKHPLFEYARSFDFIIITDVGLINVDVKNWNQKTFYHFDVPDQHLEEGQPQYNTEKLSVIILAIDIIVSLKQHVLVSILFIEILQDNRVIYEFYDHDPYDKAANNAKALKDKIENDYNF